LFRAEALAAQQHKFYGEILIIRPFSLAMLAWLGIGVSAAVLGFLLLGTYTEKAHLGGVLLPGEREADLFLPAQKLKFVRVGQSIQIHCRSCSRIEAQTRVGAIAEISKSALTPDELPSQTNNAARGPMYKVRVIFPAYEGEPFAEGARLEANLPLGRKPLLERGDSVESGNP
jgi:hypothetical protein